MPRRTTIRVGILFAILPWFAISCGTKTATQPGLSESITSMPAPEQFLTSAQGESRELLINGRPTPIEWNIAGPPTFVLMHGEGGAGDFYLSIRSVWSTDRFGAPAAMYFLLQWPDLSASVLERPIVNDSVDVLDDQGNLLVDCRDKTDSLGNVVPGNDVLLRPTSWHRSNIEEDQVVVEIFSDSLGSYPADNWRWGAGTTDPVFPSSTVEFANAANDGDSLGQFTHPAAGVVEDRYDTGAGPVDDGGDQCFRENFTLYPNGIVPNFIAGKGARDTRLNRGHPVAYTIWYYVRQQLSACDSLNPVRIDDSGVRDKTWNPGDYVPSYMLIFPTLSQFDVLARGGWDAGKWNLEIRRKLATPWPDDVELVPGRTYMMRVTVYDASSTRGSRSALLPLKLKLR
jgi:hypothetical protein